MDVYEYAMNMEVAGEKFYRDLAGATNHPGLRRVMIMLADEEVKHYQMIKAMKKTGKVETPTHGLFDDAKHIFEKAMEENPDAKVDEKEEEFYLRVAKMEADNGNFYAEKAATASDEKEKKFLEFLAEEERKHEYLMLNLLDFIKEPDHWIADAEWSNVEF